MEDVKSRYSGISTLVQSSSRMGNLALSSCSPRQHVVGMDCGTDHDAVAIHGDEVSGVNSGSAHRNIHTDLSDARLATTHGDCSEGMDAKVKLPKSVHIADGAVDEDASPAILHSQARHVVAKNRRFA